LFSFSAAVFCLKNLTIARKIFLCPTKGGCMPPSSNAYGDKTAKRTVEEGDSGGGAVTVTNMVG